MPSQHFKTILAGAVLSFALAVAAPLAAQPSKSERKWVRSTLADLSLREKAAQMVMVRAFGRYSHPRSDTHRDLLAEVRDLGVGGLVIFDSDLESIPRLLDELQQAADIPLLVAVDAERGMSFRVRRGTVSLPYAMAIGATGSADAARFAGEVTAREGLALGIHWTLAPVADVNNNPANPIINIRSFGEDPELVARMVRAFIAGARAEGQLTTAKHFPGHGDTAIDSHVALPTLDVDRARLDAIELAPFRAAIAAGVDTVMLGHIAVPAVDPSGAPATLSKAIATDLLRGELGFRGLIVTDALEMDGLAAWTGAAAVQSVQAGADVLLLPADPRVAVQSLVRAVEEGEISEARLDASVTRILAAKARLGLHRRRQVDPGAVEREVARPEDVARALTIAEDSITVVRNDGGILPLRAEKPLRLLHLVISSDLYDIASRRFSATEIAARRVEVETRYLGPEVTAETIDELVTTAAAYSSHVVVSAFARTASSEGRSELSPSQAGLLRRLHGSGRPVILISFGSPYLLMRLSEIPAYIAAYGAAEVSQRAAIAVLFGETDAGGRLPVTLPGLYDAGHGLEIPRREMTLPSARPEAAGFRPDGFAEVDRLLDGFVEQGAFPGGVLAVGHRGALVHLRPFGRLSYDKNIAPVSADSLYDLASLTKVVATTTMAMILVDEERLDLDSPVQDFLPRFRGAGKEAVTVRHLLTHSSGIDWWAPLYEELGEELAGIKNAGSAGVPPASSARAKAFYLERIQAMDLAYEPGSKSLYSDLGLILLGEILERVAGEPLDEFVRRRVFAPLGMAHTLFRPGAELRERIAPTEDDPWRGRMLRGEVHDENAFALGGVAPHAGLFATAGDLARFAQMILYGGVFEHRRIVSRTTVENFTRIAGVPESSRALGWDTKSPEKSSAGTLFSPRSFGHTGFTGTSLWIDPDRELFVILLTNRVHPTRDNILIRQVRPVVADAVVRALAEP